MIPAETLNILRCPETMQRLQFASTADLSDLRQRITSGTVKNRGGKQVSEPLEAGLIREDRKILYPIRREIPVLLIDEGIPL